MSDVNTTKARATLVAEQWGYAAFAADIYGKDLHQVPNITQRIELANFYRGNPDIFAERMKAAVDEFSALPEVDGDNIVIMGYCFGGKRSLYIFAQIKMLKC